MPDIWTIRRLISWTTEYFEKHGVEEARLDAELLLARVLEKPRIYLYTEYDQIMNPDELARFKAFIKKRVDGYSVAAIIGEKEFMGISFAVDEHVLIPRPDTEAWLEKIIARYRNLPEISVLDLGTGSGAIAVSFLSFCKEARAVAVDLSEEALSVARANGEKAGVASRVEWRQGDFLTALAEEETFDVILTNPPYIPTADIEGLSPEVRREPRMALDGGADGLDFYRKLSEGAAAHLAPGGLLAAEIGIGEAADVAKLFEAGGMTEIEIIKDYGGIERAVVGKLVISN